MIESKVINCINWHGLPCVHITNDKKDVAAIFTNIDGELVVCEVPWSDIYLENTYNQMCEARGFECLGRTMPMQDEFTLVLSLTERCNALCTYCFLNAQTTGLTMGEELLKKAINFAKDRFPNRKINIAAFGGEPTIAPKLLKLMVSYGKENFAEQCRFSITTNGYFNDEICGFLIDTFY